MEIRFYRPKHHNMDNTHTNPTVVFASFLLLAIFTWPANSVMGFQQSVPEDQRIIPEQQTLQIRNSVSWPADPYGNQGVPDTVSRMSGARQPLYLSLDDAIQIALKNADVVRVLAGVSAVSSGRTVYDVAISNTDIEAQSAAFDPSLSMNNNFSRSEQPGASFDPANPGQSIISGIRSDDFNHSTTLSKLDPSGRIASLSVNASKSTRKGQLFPLNPESRSSVDLSLTQPLLQGRGRDVNLAPLVVARINTERSFFQYKDQIQSLVSGTISAYWSLVLARTDVWIREQQVEQFESNYRRTIARQKREFASAAELAQTESALANFKATLISARANLILREAAIRNLLGLPPVDQTDIIPISPPVIDRTDFNWDELVALAENNRPDIIELKLILEADDQLLTQANNNALPQLDAVANYRWNGLAGEMPNNAVIAARGGQFADWTLGINFSVPIGLRAGRANLRRQELVIQRDRLNLKQGVHSMVHNLAISVRNLDQFFEQYKAFKDARRASRLNLEQQRSEYKNGRTIFLNVQQAITDWGNAINSEAQSITQYNTELANIELETGTILETHGIRFVEERYGTIGPLRTCRQYPKTLSPTQNTARYQSTNQPAEQSFDLEEFDENVGGNSKPKPNVPNNNSGMIEIDPNFDTQDPQNQNPNLRGPLQNPRQPAVQPMPKNGRPEVAPMEDNFPPNIIPGIPNPGRTAPKSPLNLPIPQTNIQREPGNNASLQKTIPINSGETTSQKTYLIPPQSYPSTAMPSAENNAAPANQGNFQSFQSPEVSRSGSEGRELMDFTRSSPVISTKERFNSALYRPDQVQQQPNSSFHANLPAHKLAEVQDRLPQNEATRLAQARSPLGTSPLPATNPATTQPLNRSDYLKILAEANQQNQQAQPATQTAQGQSNVSSQTTSGSLGLFESKKEVPGTPAMREASASRLRFIDATSSDSSIQR